MSPKNFNFRVFAYLDDDGTYTGVCLDLNIVEEGFINIQSAINSISDAIDSHMSVVKEMGFPKELTNRPAPKEYWKKLEEMSQIKPKSTMSPFQYFLATNKGQSSLYA